MKKEYLIKGVKLLIPQKIWLKMKLITVFLFLVTFCLQANNTYSQNATVNLNLENVSLTDVFREIEKQSDYRFFFNSAVLSAVKKQNIKTGEKSITSVLDQLFEGTDIGYKLIDHYIVITSKKEDVSNLLARSDASIQIVGLVTDENGEPICECKFERFDCRDNYRYRWKIYNQCADNKVGIGLFFYRLCISEYYSG